MNRISGLTVMLGFGVIGLLVSGTLLAMGTPPQTTGRPSEKSIAGTNAVMLKADDMRGAPDTASALLLRIEKGMRVRLLASQGGWSQIDSAGKRGWVRVLSVSSDARDGIELSDLGALGKTPQGKVVAVAGARGLDEESLKSASYQADEIERLQGYAMSRSEAEQFAQAAGLHPRAMNYLAAPVR